MSNTTPSLILLLIMIMISILILTNTFHPISIIIMSMVYNITLSIYMTLWKTLPMFPLMFMLIMISGLLIIFLYFASTISNIEPCRHFNYKSILIISFIWMTSNTQLYPYLKSSNTSNLNFNLMDQSPHFLNVMFKTPLSSLTLISMIYLLMCLMAIIKICSPKIKTLRKLN